MTKQVTTIAFLCLAFTACDTEESIASTHLVDSDDVEFRGGALPITSDTTHALPGGGYLRVIERGPGPVVLVLNGQSGEWTSATGYLSGSDPTRYMEDIAGTLAVVEMVNPYGQGMRSTNIDPLLFTADAPGELPFHTWGWMPWSLADTPPFAVGTPGAYPLLVDIGDAIEAVLPTVDYFVGIGHNSPSHSYGCVGTWGCQGHTVMAYGGAGSFAFAQDIATDLGLYETEWAAWDVDHPVAGFPYDGILNPAAAADRWAGTAAQWAHETWGADAVEMIYPSNTPLATVAKLFPGEANPQPAAPDTRLYRDRAFIEDTFLVPATLRAIGDYI